MRRSDDVHDLEQLGRRPVDAALHRALGRPVARGLRDRHRERARRRGVRASASGLEPRRSPSSTHATSAPQICAFRDDGGGEDGAVGDGGARRAGGGARATKRRRGSSGSARRCRRRRSSNGARWAAPKGVIAQLEAAQNGKRQRTRNATIAETFKNQDRLRENASRRSGRTRDDALPEGPRQGGGRPHRDARRSRPSSPRCAPRWRLKLAAR